MNGVPAEKTTGVLSQCNLDHLQACCCTAVQYHVGYRCKKIMGNTVLCCFYLQTNDPVINIENDEKLMLKSDLSLLENGIGEF